MKQFQNFLLVFMFLVQATLFFCLACTPTRKLVKYVSSAFPQKSVDSVANSHHLPKVVAWQKFYLRLDDGDIQEVWYWIDQDSTIYTIECVDSVCWLKVRSSVEK